MKRKRGNGKRKPKMAPAVGANEAFLNTEGHSGLDDLDNVEFDSRMEAETPKSDTSKSSQQAGLVKRRVVNVRAEDSANSLPEMDITVTGNLSQEAGSINRRSSRGMGSSNINLSSNAVLVQGGRTHKKEPKLPHQDPRYKEQELNVALAVIKKVMEMDAAEPFNAPVDAVALGIPDYFDVIDTPMDFGTICSNLENGVKYLNSEDVFKDVQYIWENCSKYNNKGHYILELMKQVKKNFTKYWTTSGLYNEQPQGNNESPMRCYTRGHRCPVDPMTDNPSPQQDQMGLSQLQLHQPSSSYSQPGSCQPQPSQLQGDTNLGSAGHSRLPPSTESPMKCSTCRHQCPVGPMTENPSFQHQDQMGVSQPQLHQSSPSYSQPCQSQQRPCGCQLSSVQPQPSQPQAGTNIGIAGHIYLSPPTESTMRRSKRGPSCLVGPMTDTPSHQLRDQIGPRQLQSHQPSASYSQLSSSQTQPSQPQAGTDISGADSGSLRRRTRGPTRCLYLQNTGGKRIFIATNKLGQPIGLEAPKLTNFLGTIARSGHIAPLTYVNWRALPDSNKENMWQKVQSKFDIDPKSKSWVLKSIGKKWKDWKAKLKASHYNTHVTDEERLADRDERVLPDQWRILILFWNSKEAKKRSVTNKANRAQQKMSHTTGTKSFARVREEQRAKRPDGKEPSRTELFILTRTRKNGQPVNEASAVVISKLCERAAQQQETSQNSTAKDDIFSQVMGQDRHGRVRTYGLGPSPSDLGDPKPSRVEAIRMVSEANAEVREMKERMMAMERTCTQMAAQMATMMSMMSTMQRRFPEEHLSNVADISNSSEGSPQLQVHSSLFGCGGPSHERRATKRQCRIRV